MKYLKIYTNFIQDMEELTDEEKGRLFVMMLQYAAGEHPSPEGNERFVWGTARKNIDAQRVNYEEMCARNKKNVKKRYDSLPVATTRYDSNEEKEQEKEKEQKQEQKEKKRTAVLPPTPTDIKNYCLERKNQVDYERFWDYYNDRNWKTRTGEPLNWKEKVRQWEKSDNKNKDKPRNYGSENYDQRTIRMDELTNFI